MSKNASGLRRGDHVRVLSTGAHGSVVDVDVHTIVVRLKQDDGEPIQHHYRLDDLERLPDTKERALIAEAQEKHADEKHADEKNIDEK
jgi:preprotein translocase subunit YajC